MPSLEIHIDGSTPFAALLAFASLLALSATALLTPLLAALLSPVVVVISAMTARQHVLANFNDSPRRIERLSNGRWLLGLRSGAVVEVERAPEAFIHRYLVVASFVATSDDVAQKRSDANVFGLLRRSRRHWFCCVPATRNNVAEHRLLRMLLRHDGGAAAGIGTTGNRKS